MLFQSPQRQEKLGLFGGYGLGQGEKNIIREAIMNKDDLSTQT